jgi:prepilin-type N-terminal cleavage/methylation domain-containing protein
LRGTGLAKNGTRLAGPDLVPICSRSGLRDAPRGFTLVELMVVVVIIAALAVLAVPAVGQQLKNRWAGQAAQEVALLYRNARMQTRGRGSAVLFRFNGASQGSVQVFEAIRGSADPNPNCVNLPISSCSSPNWNNATQRRLVASLDPTTNRHYTEVNLVVGSQPADQANTGQIDVCFTPMGRTLWRTDTTTPLTQALTGAIAIYVLQKTAGGTTYGLTRPVLLLPNGASRMGVAVGVAP